MAPSMLRKTLGAVKDQTSIGIARMGGADEVAADVDVAIVKATGHGESFPADERHVQEILTLTRYSRARVAACVASLSRRLGHTRAWAVALKTLALVHRLLADGDPAYEQEVFLATRRGRRLLDMSRFGNRSRSRAWDFSAFVRAYAAYLDDRLIKHRMQGRGGGVASPGKWRLGGRCDSFHDTEGRYEVGEAVSEAWAFVPTETPATVTTTEELVAKAQHLKHLLDRFVACRPTGKARTNRVVKAALYTLVKESVVMYCELTEVMAALIDRFAELEIPSCVRVHSIFTSLTKLLDELDDFYSWYKAAAVCRPADIPEIEPITQKKLDLMDDFIRDRQALVWQRRRSLQSSPAPSILAASRATKNDTNATKPLPAPRELQVAAQEEKNAGKAPPAEPAGSLIVVDDQMADFLNLKEDTAPSLSSEEHGRNLALALFDGGQAEPAPKWEAFDDPSTGGQAEPAPKWEAFDDPSTDWETALMQSASRLATQRAELGGDFNTTELDGMYSHAAANATATKERAFAGSASCVAMRSPGATVLALPTPPGASAAATAARADPFAASLGVPPPTYVQMTDMQTRQQLLVEEQMMWQQYERQKASLELQ